ncbi:MAG TPA: hypothetical protein VFU50_09285 [Terriglobales bacterium]|nr:hypothetical protein [Terriglobales bacterium]
MKPSVIRICALLFTLLWLATVAASAGAIHAKRAGMRQASNSDVPLLLFQSIDNRLTSIDEENQKLSASAHKFHRVRKVGRQKQLLRQLQHSKQSRDRLQRVRQLLAISSRAEQRYRNRHQAYGATLFRDLHAKVSSVKTALLHAQKAPTVPAWSREEQLVNTRMLSVITQFQAISGGYVALACHPGSWACCQPRMLRDGKVVVRGCTWSCASKLAACRGGCLGRRTPNTVVAVRNTPKPPIFAKSPKLATTQVQTTKPKSHVPVPATRQGSATGQ